ATLTRLLTGATFVKELNILSSSEQGWLEGYTYQNNDKSIHVLFLNSTPQSKVTLSTPDEFLLSIDVMGNETRLIPTNGKVQFNLEQNLPIFIIGKINDAPEPVKYPEDTLLKEVEIPLQNPNFEQDELSSGNIVGWNVMTDEITAKGDKKGGFLVSLDSSSPHEGRKSLRMEAKTLTKWYGVRQEIPLTLLPVPKEDEYLVFKVSCMGKGKEVYGKGLGYTIAFRKEDFSRIHFFGSTYFGYGGTYDWKELSGTHKLKTIPLGTERISMEFHLAKSTGILWLDQIKVLVQLWKSGSPTRSTP
ncbi:MAG: hypothetical protein V4507_14275, partial [Verrucomicrobiota bacterium]